MGGCLRQVWLYLHINTKVFLLQNYYIAKQEKTPNYGAMDGFLNKMAKMAPYCSPDYQASLWVNWPFSSREEGLYRFSRWWPSWISNQNDFSYFQSPSHLHTSNEVSSHRFSTWLLWGPSWISDQNDFSYFWSTSHPDTSYQVLTYQVFKWICLLVQEKCSVMAILDFWPEGF